MNKHILRLNAHVKYIEFLLHSFDEENEEVTIGEIRIKFKESFNYKDKLLNQYFGIYRLIPLLLIKEEYKKIKSPLEGDVKTIKIIRDALSHGKFTFDENGYYFSDGKEELTLSYEEYNSFLYRIENDYYNKIY